MQEGVKMRSFCSQGKDKDEITTVHLKGDRMQTRQSKSKRIGPEKEAEIPPRRRRKKKWLRINGSANPSGSLILRDRCFIYFLHLDISVVTLIKGTALLAWGRVRHDYVFMKFLLRSKLWSSSLNKHWFTVILLHALIQTWSLFYFWV